MHFRVEFSPAAWKWEELGGCKSRSSNEEKAGPIGKIVADEFLLDQLILVGKTE